MAISGTAVLVFPHFPFLSPGGFHTVGLYNVLVQKSAESDGDESCKNYRL